MKKNKYNEHRNLFKDHESLRMHIERMAITGVTGSVESWSDFILALNSALKRERETP